MTFEFLERDVDACVVQPLERAIQAVGDEHRVDVGLSDAGAHEEPAIGAARVLEDRAVEDARKRPLALREVTAHRAAKILERRNAGREKRTETPQEATDRAQLTGPGPNVKHERTPVYSRFLARVIAPFAALKYTSKVMRLLLTSVLAAVLCAGPSRDARAHDVTTRVTWNREISRIVYARCASCHRPGGSAFSLLTFQDAYPWARAIKDNVLERSMPPWGAVKGFGAFRNERALSQEELGLVEAWVNGGAPEGNPNDLPPRGRIPTATPAGEWGGVVTAGPGYTFASRVLLDGFRVKGPAPVDNAQITIAFPDGRVVPLVWLHGYVPIDEPFLLRSPLAIPEGAVLRGLPTGVILELLAAAPAPRGQ